MLMAKFTIQHSLTECMKWISERLAMNSPNALAVSIRVVLATTSGDIRHISLMKGAQKDPAGIFTRTAKRDEENMIH